MRKQLIESIGDFTTYQQVGYEDYEELTSKQTYFNDKLILNI